MKSTGVIGSSNSAWSVSCYLSSLGYDVYMLVRHFDMVKTIAEKKEIKAYDKLNGTFKIKDITDNTEEFMKQVSTIFICTVTTAYMDVMRRISPYLRQGHEIILFSSKLGGVLEVTNFLREKNITGVKVIETDAIFASRIVDPETVWIRGYKKWNLYSSENASETEKNSSIIKNFFPDLEQAENFIQRGLTDFGAMAHPLIMLANMNKVDRQEKFLFYYEGFTEHTISLLEEMEKERNAIGQAYNTSFISLKELLDKYYCCMRDNLYDTLVHVPNYSKSISTNTLNHRFVMEDICCSLVPAWYLARTADIKTPLIDSVINIFSVILKRNFLQEGRTMEKLGLSGKNKDDILKFIYT
ncbi:MAG: NAD/NADP octopine/nopaline dehydrogenase family protein [Candidatus Eremiobacterota bacterium]